MVVAKSTRRWGSGRLPRGARGRYAPPPQLFTLAATDPVNPGRGPLLVERDAEGAYLVRHRDSGRLIARTADSATLQRLLTTLTNDDVRMANDG